MSKLWQVVWTALSPLSKKAAERNGSLDGPSEPLPSKSKVITGNRIPESGQEETWRAWQSGIGPVRSWVFRVLRHKMVLLMAGGALGTALRYLLSKWLNEQSWARGFPYSTFLINVSGSFVLGAAAIVFLERLSPQYQDWYLLIGTGFCGGYTTFSTFEWETYKLVRDGSWWYALLNIFGSVVVGFLGILLAVLLVQIIFPRQS